MFEDEPDVDKFLDETNLFDDWEHTSRKFRFYNHSFKRHQERLHHGYNHYSCKEKKRKYSKNNWISMSNKIQDIRTL